jgi:hypothetical protein
MQELCGNYLVVKIVETTYRATQLLHFAGPAEVVC